MEQSTRFCLHQRYSHICTSAGSVHWTLHHSQWLFHHVLERTKTRSESLSSDRNNNLYIHKFVCIFFFLSSAHADGSHGFSFALTHIVVASALSHSSDHDISRMSVIHIYDGFRVTSNRSVAYSVSHLSLDRHESPNLIGELMHVNVTTVFLCVEMFARLSSLPVKSRLDGSLGLAVRRWEIPSDRCGTGPSRYPHWNNTAPSRVG